MDNIEKANQRFEEKIAQYPESAPALAFQEIVDMLRNEVTISAEEVGKYFALTSTRKMLTVVELFQLEKLKAMKVHKAYRFGDWKIFCSEILGISRSVYQEQRNLLKKFGAEFYEASRQIGLSRQVLRDLKALPGDVAKQAIKGNIINIDGEEIPMTPEHAEDIDQALNGLISRHAMETVKNEEKQEKAYQRLRKAEELNDRKDKTIANQQERIRELSDEKFFPETERYISGLYLQVIECIHKLEACAMEVEDQDVRTRLFLYTINGLEEAGTKLRQQVTRIYKLPETEEYKF